MFRRSITTGKTATEYTGFIDLISFRRTDSAKAFVFQNEPGGESIFLFDTVRLATEKTFVAKHIIHFSQEYLISC